jgi:hypothetical protein
MNIELKRPMGFGHEPRNFIQHGKTLSKTPYTNGIVYARFPVL